MTSVVGAKTTPRGPKLRKETIQLHFINCSKFPHFAKVIHV